MNSKLQIRAFIVHELMDHLGAGVTSEKLVQMANDIEGYMLKGITVKDVPETVDSIIGGISDIASALIGEEEKPKVKKK